MKSRIAFPLALAANAALVCLCLLYRRGAMLLYAILVLLHILLFLLNGAVARSKLQLILLGLIHIAATVCTHQQFGWLYLHNVCDDVEGKAIVMLGTWVGAVWTAVLLAASMLRFNRRQKADKLRGKA